MTWSRSASRWVVLAYALVAGLVVAGMIWATDVALTLERSQVEDDRKTDYSRRLQRARRRIDSRLLTMLSQEEGASPYDYRLQTPPRPLYRGVDKVDATGLWQLSPLASRRLHDWLIMHFQASSLGWSSPEADLREVAWLPGMDASLPNVSMEAMSYLGLLWRTLKPEELGDLFFQAQARDLINATWEQRAKQGYTEYVQLWREWEKDLRESRAPASCDPRDLALVGLYPQLPVAEAESEDADGDAIESPAVHAPLADAGRDSGDVEVFPSPMTPIWLQLVGRKELSLAYVRTVTVEHERLFQGFLVDWPLLREQLLKDIEDEFPDARLVPLESGPVDDFDSLLTKLPATIATGVNTTQLAAVGWTPLRTGLLLAWIAAVTVLAAVALGIQSLLALAERRRQFAYAVSHELRTPLTTFRLYTDMLASGFVPPERRDEYLKTLNHESERLSHLVSGVLEYSRIEHQSVNLAVSDTTVGEMLELARQRFDAHCQESDRELVIEPDGVADVPCRTDVDLALQIVGTLIDNACKYSAEAKDRRIILSAGNGHPGVIHFEVSDFGPGISRRERRRIFKPFRRGRNCATNSAGIGLGLALASRWARLLGGHLRLAPAREHPQGATFRLSVPVNLPT